jgi:hypothetical protein
MVKLWSSFVESDTSARLIALWLDTIYLEGDLDVISGGSDADVFKLSYQDQAVKSGLTNLIKDFGLCSQCCIFVCLSFCNKRLNDVDTLSIVKHRNHAS